MVWGHAPAGVPPPVGKCYSPCCSGVPPFTRDLHAPPALSCETRIPLVDVANGGSETRLGPFSNQSPLVVAHPTPWTGSLLWIHQRQSFWVVSISATLRHSLVVYTEYLHSSCCRAQREQRLQGRTMTVCRPEPRSFSLTVMSYSSPGARLFFSVSFASHWDWERILHLRPQRLHSD